MRACTREPSRKVREIIRERLQLNLEVVTPDVTTTLSSKKGWGPSGSYASSQEPQGTLHSPQEAPQHASCSSFEGLQPPRFSKL